MRKITEFATQNVRKTFGYFFQNYRFQKKINKYALNVKTSINAHIDFIKFVIITLFWFKIRVLYYTNNWIYTTNHKRIAVNYFWFVILSGIIGMVLATVIRLEFAYPGVGIFAGDSLQYLSLVTAHGVIMVFFMIMPLLLGAFANFLLPTQLGVHDVAFPRLNSAAFWFLPGGLLMLAQLVCVDRRYQRMNCFNIREIQSILKKRFFVDLLNTHEHKKLIHKTMIDLKYNVNNEFENTNLFIFFNYGIEFNSKNRFLFLKLKKQTNSTFLNETAFFFHHIKLLKYFSIFSFFDKFYISLYKFLSGNFFLINNFKTTCYDIFFFTLTSFFSLELFFNKTYVVFTNVTNFFVNDVFSNFSFTMFFFFINKISFHVFDFFINFFFFLYAHSTYFNIFNKKFIIFFWTQFNKININLLEFFFFFNLIEIFYFYNSIVIKSPFSFNLIQLTHIWEILKQNLFISNIENIHSSNRIEYYFKKNSLYSLNNNVYYQIFENDLFITNKNNFDLWQISKFYSYYNFNSHISYTYVVIHLISHIPLFFYNIITNIFNFKEMSNNVNHFFNLLTSWYVPLLINENLFYFAWQQFFYTNNKRNSNLSNFYLIFKPINFFDNDFVLFFNNFFLKIYNFFFFLYEMLWVVFSYLTFCFKLLIMILFNFEIYNFFNIILLFYKNLNYTWAFNKKTLNLNFNSKHFENSNFNKTNLLFNEELSVNSRYHRFDNPIFKYDYKSGDYYPKLYKELYSFLSTSVIELTGGLRQSPWYFSTTYDELSFENFSNFSNQFDFNFKKWNFIRFNSADGFYNFFFLLKSTNLFLNKRWVAVSAIDQKFYKFFHTSSMQQRIYNNWRQLKFTREAWRCKLLMSRHQKTLFKRYVNEDGVFWSIERNAKDLLPGWAMITPFSSRTRFTAIGKTDIGLMGVLLVLNSSIISAANFIVTYRYLSTLNNRKMRDARSFFTEAIMVASWMMIAANPMLVIGIIMLLSDRHWQTSFFDYSGGGDTVLFQHMFWFFGHPEVYIIILPTFGFVNTMLSYYLKKRVSARASLLYSMYTIAFLGFFVWGHHMYMVGLAHTTRMLFSTLTVMISVPAATKLMHWCVTTVNSSFVMELPLICTLTFIFLFVSGGISGMCVAHTGMDVLFHDTFYVIGHFHVMFAGAAMIASFGAFYFYFVAIFGVKYSRIYAYLHFVYYLLGQLFTVIPMFWLGYAGMPRRVLDYPSSFGGWHSVISGGHMLSVAGLIAFFVMIFDSLRQAKAVTRNTFGIGRYNTRLNFYVYEIAKLNNIQEKAWTLFKFLQTNTLKLNNLRYYNFEHFETIIFSYTFSINKKN